MYSTPRDSTLKDINLDTFFFLKLLYTSYYKD